MPLSALALPALLLLCAASAAGFAPQCLLTLSGEAEKTLISSSELCPLERAGDRGQDAAARAYRGADGTVFLTANNEAGNYRSARPPGAAAFARQCARPPYLAQARSGSGGAAGAAFPALYASPLDANGDCYLGGADSRPGSCWQNATQQSGGQPLGLYSPNQFIMATWAEGATVHAFGQATLYGNGAANPLLPGCWAACPEGQSGSFFQYMTGLRSSDGGASFAAVSTPQLGAGVFVPSQPFSATNAGNSYISSMTNVVRIPGDATRALYTQTHGFGDCLWRTDDIADPLAWRAWDGAAFSIPAQSPYGGAAAGLNCSSSTGATQLGSITWSDVCGAWVGVGGQRVAGHSGPVVSYSTSTDLLHWSEAALLMPAAGADGEDNYAALLDFAYAHAGANFECSGPAPLLVYRRMDADNKGATTYAREVAVAAVPGLSPATLPNPPAMCAA
jgi:hypothetical protein